MSDKHGLLTAGAHEPPLFIYFSGWPLRYANKRDSAEDWGSVCGLDSESVSNELTMPQSSPGQQHKRSFIGVMRKSSRLLKAVPNNKNMPSHFILS